MYLWLGIVLLVGYRMYLWLGCALLVGYITLYESIGKSDPLFLLNSVYINIEVGQPKV